jgi:hypothetical protein
MTLEALSEAVVKAGLEIYRADPSEIRIAERVRMHLMDSGVAIALAPAPRVLVTVRVQRSDFPMASERELFETVRTALRDSTQARGYDEANAAARDIVNPGDASDVLDVWHELTYQKAIGDLAMLISELQWALTVPKCVEP